MNRVLLELRFGAVVLNESDVSGISSRFQRFHVFMCRILGESTATLPSSHRWTHRGALGLTLLSIGPTL